jgi:hypothetical protein
MKKFHAMKYAAGLRKWEIAICERSLRILSAVDMDIFLENGG